MDKMIIEGGERLSGTVHISGAKNAALPILVSALLAEGPCTFYNVPELMDIRTVNKLLRGFGADVEGTKAVRIDASHINNVEAPYDLVKTMRASVLVLGPLVTRMGRARVSLPGGCAIGARPVNLHLKALEEMGAKVTLTDGYIEAEAPRLHGAKIHFDIQTVTGTENIMMAACLAEGTDDPEERGEGAGSHQSGGSAEGHGGKNHRCGDGYDHDRGSEPPDGRGGNRHGRSDRGGNLHDRRGHHRW